MMQNEYFKTKAAAKTAAEEFNVLIGKSPGEVFPAGSLNSSFAGITGKTEGFPDSPQRYLESAERNNFDLIKINQEYKAAMEAEKRRSLMFLPSVDLDFRLVYSGVNITENPPLSSLSMSFDFSRIMENSEMDIEFLNSAGSFRSAAGSIRTGLPQTESGIPGRVRTRFIIETAEHLKSSLLIRIQGLLDSITYRKATAELLREQIVLNQKNHSIMEKRVEIGELMLTDLAESQIELSRLKISLMDTATGILNSELELIRLSGMKAPVVLLETIVNEGQK
jgi:outer membrane protein TolC